MKIRKSVFLFLFFFFSKYLIIFCRKLVSILKEQTKSHSTNLIIIFFNHFLCCKNCISNIGACLDLTKSITVQLQIEEISRKLRTGELNVAQLPEERFEHICT